MYIDIKWSLKMAFFHFGLINRFPAHEEFWVRIQNAHHFIWSIAWSELNIMQFQWYQFIEVMYIYIHVDAHASAIGRVFRGCWRKKCIDCMLFRKLTVLVGISYLTWSVRKENAFGEAIKCKWIEHWIGHDHFAL